ncbi:hypothetical protein [Fidelibacter multiformis]|jgi:hypothetical protein|uniref:hypothetical protein n=1 Tax=Fidelibacter multiformis TaxID=3377529 RepID=UPI0037DD3BF0
MNELTLNEMMEYTGGYLPGSYLACLAGIVALGFGIFTSQGMVMNIGTSLIFRYCD